MSSTPPTPADELRGRIKALDPAALPEAQRADAGEMLKRQIHARLAVTNRADTEAWNQVTDKASWEAFRDERIERMRAALGPFPDLPDSLKLECTGTVDGDGFTIEKLVFEPRAGLPVTALLYVPKPARAKAPAVVICHSHHNPKEQGELQDMGMLWARAGALVLVPDLLPHGERSQNPFGGREDYFARYCTNVQLDLIEESLIGWMAWDQMRCIDVLLARKDVDPKRVILLGAVAGGGDPCAVTVALDERITGSAPFNFGGPQPETTYPLDANAAVTFNYAGTGSWETTRNLRLSARDAFLPWTIVGAAAPRPLNYAHEFAWDEANDPVWSRLQRIYGFYGADEKLSALKGWGKVTLRPPEASHCNNIGVSHREMLFPWMERCFSMPVPAEYQQRLEPEALRCLTDAAKAKRTIRLAHEIARETGAKQLATARERLASRPDNGRRERLRADWDRLLGGTSPKNGRQQQSDAHRDGNLVVERLVLETEPGIAVPALLLLPAKEGAPIAVGLAQAGKAWFLKERAGFLAELLLSGVAVCLPDLRGCGETAPGLNDDRSMRGRASGLSSTEQMLGGTLLGARLRDVRTILKHLRARTDLDASRVALWGESFAQPNAPGFADTRLKGEEAPRLAEPLGALLAVLGALFEDDVTAVLARGGLVSYAALLETPFTYVAHDANAPGALKAGDLPAVVAALGGVPMRFEGFVDGRNALASHELMKETYRDADGVMASAQYSEDAASWLARMLSGS